MGLRFNRSVRLFPGVRINLGTHGASLSVGAPGASINIGPRGTYGNVGIPGSGLSYRHRLDAPGHVAASQPQQIPCRIALQGDRVVVIPDDSRMLTPDDENRIMRANATPIREMLDQEVQLRNSSIEADLRPVQLTASATDPKPERMQGESQPDYLGRVGRWRAQAANNMEERLVAALETVDWGRETNISCQIDGARVLLDIDLPEIEDIPDFVWKVAPRGQPAGLVRIDIAAGELNRRYVRIVAGIVRKALGSVVEGLPSIGGVAASAYTTRSGGDDYVIVAEITRAAWSETKGETDDEIALFRMGARLDMTSTGRLRPQTPITS